MYPLLSSDRWAAQAQMKPSGKFVAELLDFAEKSTEAASRSVTTAELLRLIAALALTLQHMRMETKGLTITSFVRKIHLP